MDILLSYKEDDKKYFKELYNFFSNFKLEELIIKDSYNDLINENHFLNKKLNEIFYNNLSLFYKKKDYKLELEVIEEIIKKDLNLLDLKYKDKIDNFNILIFEDKNYINDNYYKKNLLDLINNYNNENNLIEFYKFEDLIKLD